MGNPTVPLFFVKYGGTKWRVIVMMAEIVQDYFIGSMLLHFIFHIELHMQDVYYFPLGKA